MTNTTATAENGTEPYRWTPLAQRQFLEALAETGSIAQASTAASKSRRSAYNLRFRREGAAFRMGWDGAVLIARATLSDSLLERALDGQEDVSVRDPDTRTTTRFRRDNRLGMSLLSRLDAMAGPKLDDHEAMLARIIGQDFEAYLDLIESGGTGAAAALFVDARGPQKSVTDESNEQCELEDEDEEVDYTSPAYKLAGLSVWFAEDKGDWCTDFPPPPGFTGDEDGSFGDYRYCRELSASEQAAHEKKVEEEAAPLLAAASAARDAHFGFVAVAPKPLPKPKPVKTKAVDTVAQRAAEEAENDARFTRERPFERDAFEDGEHFEVKRAMIAEPVPEPEPVNADEFAGDVRIYVPGTRDYTGEYQKLAGFRQIKVERSYPPLSALQWHGGR
jgi:hypothetical protein